VTFKPLNAYFELRLHCRDCHTVQFVCPICAEPFALVIPPAGPFPFIPPPHTCPDCRSLLHPRVVGYEPNPTNERPAPEALSDSLAALERSYQASPSVAPAPVPLELAQAWSLILSRLELPSTRMLLSQQAHLIEISQTRAVVAVVTNWAAMVRTRAELIRDAIQRVSGHRPALEVLPVAELPGSPAVASIRPPAPVRPAPAAATKPRRTPTRRRRPARRAGWRAAPPPPTYQQPCPSTANRRTLTQWQAQGLPLDQLPPATVAKGYRQAFGCLPRKLRQSCSYSSRELAAVLQQLGQPIPAPLQGLEVAK
jgi:DNA polymerase III subunit gamma/tau